MRFSNIIGLLAALPALTSAFTISDVTSKAATSFAKRSTVSEILTDLEDAASKLESRHLFSLFRSVSGVAMRRFS
jgi:hypothetical protein